MVRELYKIMFKKYYLALIVLLFLPAIVGIGYIFDLSYMMDGEEIAGSALSYCAEMQQLIKYFYFFVVIFLSCDAFSGEMEDGQLKTVMVHVNSRKKIFLQKYLSLCLVVSLFHVLFWAANIAVYCLGSVKNHRPVIMAENSLTVYAGMFLGYLEAFFVCMSIAFLAGIFLRKLYCLVLVYFVWFVLRYADQVADIRNVSTEFMADYLGSADRVSMANVLCCLFGLFMCVAVISISICLYQRKDIN